MVDFVQGLGLQAHAVELSPERGGLSLRLLFIHPLIDQPRFRFLGYIKFGEEWRVQ